MGVVIRVQRDDFDVGEQYQNLRDQDSGAVVTFTGCVRRDDGIEALHLEHYPGMTEKALEDIVSQAQQRWPLGAVAVIHRIGHIGAGEQIVFVGVASGHRGDAFEAGEFIMDFLKTRAPFWKKEISSHGEHWVDAKQSDRAKAQRWD